MDNTKNTDGIYSQKELINKGEKLLKNGNRSFIDAKINNKRNEHNVIHIRNNLTIKSSSTIS